MTQLPADQQSAQLTATEAISSDNTATAHVEAKNTSDSKETSTKSDGLSMPTRKRTRATAEQLAVLEDTFAINVSPNGKQRKQLAERLQMSERSIQIWFQNRRAKVKHLQKRAQMQMHQATMRTHLYHYQHQQHYGYNGSSIMPLQPHYPYHQPYPPVARLPLTRAMSADVLNQQPVLPNNGMRPFSMTPGPSSTPYSVPHFTPTPPPPSMPSTSFVHANEHIIAETSPNLHNEPQGSTLPYNFHTASSHVPPVVSVVPNLSTVPHAEPTAILTTSELKHGSSSEPTNASSNMNFTGDASELLGAQDSQLLMSVLEPSTMSLQQDPSMVTIDPSSLMIATPVVTNTNDNDKESNININTTTLTIGSWHRLKLHATDILCAYQPSRRFFAWQITDNGCSFKMEIPLDTVTNIEYTATECDILADVHFDISEPPLFYMESKASEQDSTVQQKQEQITWVQCSDFTENRQASLFLRHTLKGVAHHMKQELLDLTNFHKETSHLVHFVKASPSSLAPSVDVTTMMQQPVTYLNPAYWSSMATSRTYIPSSLMNEQSVACGFLS